jgi:hypothetical protein
VDRRGSENDKFCFRHWFSHVKVSALGIHTSGKILQSAREYARGVL